MPGLATAFGSLFAILGYVGRGGTVQLREMLIPAGAAAVVSLGLWYGTRVVLERFERGAREYAKP